MKKKFQDPLPQELLPNSVLDGEPALWESSIQGLMAEVSPILAQYRTTPGPWWSILAERLRPRLAVAVAAAAAITVAVHLSLPGPAARTTPSLPLAAAIGESNAAATILSIANEEIDPVLALMILELESETP